jgi:hypothetical protein
MVSPADVVRPKKQAVDKLGVSLSLRIQPVVSCLFDIEAAPDRYYGR